MEPEYRTDFLEECWRLTARGDRHIRLRHSVLNTLIMDIGQNYLKTRLISHYQGSGPFLVNIFRIAIEGVYS